MADPATNEVLGELQRANGEREASIMPEPYSRFPRPADEPTDRREESGVFQASEFPPPVVTKVPHPGSHVKSMPFRVVVACDLGEMSEAILLEAVRTARARPPAELHILTVVTGREPYRIPGDETHKRYTRKELSDRMEEMVKNVLWRRRDQVAERFSSVAVHLGVGHAAEEILHLADDVMADLIVLGNQNHTNWHRFVHGSVTDEVIRRSEVSVMVARPTEYAHGHRVPEFDEPRMDGDWSPKLGRRHTYHIHSRDQSRNDSLIHWEM